MEQLSEKERRDCQEIFNLIDTNNDQKVSIQELGKGLRGMGLNPSEAEIQRLMDRFDSDKNKELSLQEFTELYKQELKQSSFNEEDLKAQLHQMDKDKDGKIEAEELRELLVSGEEPLSSEEVDSLIAEFDKNKDGLIEIQEFLEVILAPTLR